MMKKIILLIIFCGVSSVSHATSLGTYNLFDMYMVTTGSDTNAGSTTDSAALMYSSSGSWGTSGTLNRYISTFSAFGSASIGQMASVYFSTSTTGTIFVSSIVAVVSATTVDLDTTTIFWGIVPSTAATKPYSCKIGGAWGSLGIVTSLFAARTMKTPTMVNIKAGTYANTTNTRTFGSSGGNGNLLWWRGYNTTPGDMDNNNLGTAGTTIPSWTFTTGEMSISGAHQIFSNIDINSAYAASANGAVNPTGINITLYRFRVTNSSNVANGIPIVQNSVASNLCIQSSYFQATSTASSAVQCNGSVQCYLIGNTVNGGTIGINLNGPGSLAYGNVVYGSSVAISVGTTGGMSVINNSIYQPVFDGIRIAAASLQGSAIINNHYENANAPGAAAIDLQVSSNSLHISGNTYFNCTTNVNSNVLGNFTIYDTTTSLASAGLVNPGSQNFSLNPIAQSLGQPALFENLPNQAQSYRDSGAIQHKGYPGVFFTIAN